MSELEKLEKALADQRQVCIETWDAWDDAEAEWNVRWYAVATYRKEQDDAT